jgi:hypothetical protein
MQAPPEPHGHSGLPKHRRFARGNRKRQGSSGEEAHEGISAEVPLDVRRQALERVL